MRQTSVMRREAWTVGLGRGHWPGIRPSPGSVGDEMDPDPDSASDTCSVVPRTRVWWRLPRSSLALGPAPAAAVHHRPQPSSGPVQYRRSGPLTGVTTAV